MTVVVNTDIAGGGGSSSGGGSGGGTFTPLTAVTLGAGPTTITHDAHANRAVFSEQSASATITFTAGATASAVDGDLHTILNLGTGIMFVTGNYVLAPGNRAYAEENERFVFEYYADDDIYYGGCPDIQRIGIKNSFACLPINNVAVPSVFGCSAASVSDTSVQTAVAVAATSAFTHIQRNSYVSVAAVNRNAGATISSVPLLWPTAAIKYGWKLRFIFGASDALTGCPVFVGVCVTVLTAGTEPSAKVNIFGVAADSTDTNLHIMYNNAAGTATANAIDLGASYPANSNSADMYSATLAAFSDGTTVTAYYRVTNLISGVTTSGTITGSELPVDGTALIPLWVRGTKANSTSATLSFGGLYCGFFS